MPNIETAGRENGFDSEILFVKFIVYALRTRFDRCHPSDPWLSGLARRGSLHRGNGVVL